jgi:TetR/AcrR family transcriptional repressor of nem operon
MAALDSYCSEALSKVRLLFEQSKDPLEAARTLVRSAGRDYKNPERAERGCLVGNTSSELAAHDPEARDRVERFLNDMQETVAAGLRRAQEIGSLDTNRDPHAMAAFVQCSLQGMALLARTQSNPDVLDGLVNEALRVLGE